MTRPPIRQAGARAPTILRMALVAVATLLVLAACDEPPTAEGDYLVEGDRMSGRHLIERYGCGACHRIPGVRTARGRVGPSLEGFARRGYIAGQFPNRPNLLVRWIQAAPEMIPGTAMPAFSMTEREARDIATYLYELR